MSYNLQYPPRFYCVYLLRSIARKNSFYIGSTPDPHRRLRQHNGDLAFGGADRTKKNKLRPWQMTMVVYGFPSKISALQFEYAWHHAYRTRHIPVKNRIGTRNSGNSVHIKIANLKLLLSAHAFRRMGLRVAIFQKDIYDIWVVNRYNVSVSESVLLKLDFEENQQKLIQGGNYEQMKAFVKSLEKDEDDYFEISLEKLEQNNTRICCVCNRVVDQFEDVLGFCASKSCHALYHVQCWAEEMTKDLISEPLSHTVPPLTPVKGKCVKCQKVNWWWPTVKNSMRLHQHFTEIGRPFIKN
ncbi:hypothetical protein KL905_001510 [Ogataea polymorpha]|nr:hypothetical protein KL935_000623 [Ogataea polymorpha]KAG7913127.1 hypothetical protein KL907_000072 [Ogataea polymorpha]KAG7923244.1 hypothetical protein KL905_001510 [Ogataea polymorpha]KAG7929100.1 hypothetical protein KL925_001281 [Ogataea polymorpha]KAG7938042.1 hypothetical protein KL934_000616 [Ogataea polymorpha]